MEPTGMADPPSPPAPPSRPASEASWDGFVESYGRAILEWFRQTGLPPDAVREVVRELMERMAMEYAEVAGAPGLRFRTWLQFAAHQAWGATVERHLEAGGNGPPSPAVDLLLSTDGHDAFLRALDVECTHQRRRYALDQARPRADPSDWEVFHRLVVAGHPTDAVAAAVGCDDLAIRAAAFRAHRLLREECHRIEELF